MTYWNELTWMQSKDNPGVICNGLFDQRTVIVEGVIEARLVQISLFFVRVYERTQERLYLGSQYHIYRETLTSS